MSENRRPIYLDCNATTPVSPEVLAAMLPFFTDYFGNPSSLNHSYGWEAEAGVEKAREILGGAIAAQPAALIHSPAPLLPIQGPWQTPQFVAGIGYPSAGPVRGCHPGAGPPDLHEAVVAVHTKNQCP